jgi:hypothetical protein
MAVKIECSSSGAERLLSSSIVGGIVNIFFQFVEGSAIRLVAPPDEEWSHQSQSKDKLESSVLRLRRQQQSVYL